MNMEVIEVVVARERREGREPQWASLFERTVQRLNEVRGEFISLR